MATYTISKIQLPNGDICNLKDASAITSHQDITGKVNKTGDTMTGDLITTGVSTYNANYPSYEFKSTAASDSLATMSFETNTHKWFINEWLTDGSGNAEQYSLPAVSTTGVWSEYQILTSKNTVTIPQGGTGASNAAGARSNLGIKTAATHEAQDTVANNVNLPTGAAVINYVTGLGYTVNANATNSTSKLYLVGATEQSAEPSTYSNTYVSAENGILSAASIGINNGTAANKIKLEWNDSDSSLNFVFVEGS